MPLIRGEKEGSQPCCAIIDKQLEPDKTEEAKVLIS